jgi:hypothetical protein
MNHLAMTTSTCVDTVLALGSHNDTTTTGIGSTSIILDNETLHKSMDIYGYLQQHPTGTMLPKLLRRHHKQQQQQQQQQQQKQQKQQRQISSIEDEDDVHENDTSGDRKVEDEGEEDIFDDDDEEDEDYDGNDMYRVERNRYRQVYNNNRSKYWSCNEIIDSMNATSQQILNIQQQIMNGEDYYINNNASISIYNIYNKNNNYDTTIFLDSKSDITTNTGTGSNMIGNMNTNSSTNSIGVGASTTSMSNNAFNNTSSNSASNNNQYRWFSNSFTNVKRYQKKLLYNPTIIVPTKRYRNHQQQHINKNTISNDDANNNTMTANNIGKIQRDLSAQLILPPNENFDNIDTGSTLPNDSIEITTTTTTTATNSKRRNNDTLRSSQQQQQQQPQPARRTTKRRRKT